jgi:hypothetical protein
MFGASGISLTGLRFGNKSSIVRAAEVEAT